MRREPVLAALGAGTALLLSGCGASGSDASAAWDKARTQLEDASSVRMETVLDSDAGASAGGTVPDATVVAGEVDGADLEYTGLFHAGPYTTRDESRVVDGTRYQRFAVDESGGVSGEDRPEYAEKWTSSPVEGEGASMRTVVDALLGGVPEAGGLEGVEAEASSIRRSGHDATRYVLDEPVAGAQGGTRLQAFTVAEDDGTLLTVETIAPGSEGTVTFSDWDAVEPVEAPAEEDLAKDTAQDGQEDAPTAQ